MRHLRFLVALCVLCPLAMAQVDTNRATGSDPLTSPGFGSSSILRGDSGDVPGRGLGGMTSPSMGQPGLFLLRPDDLAERSPRRIEPLPPPRPSEFQKFVASATGRMLPVFGSNFFANPYGAQEPLDNVPVSSDYVIGPGDELVIRAWGAIDADLRATVDRNGLINLPKVGSFSVAGVRASELERHLRAQIGRVFTNFNLSATLGKLRGLKVFVVGPAQRPGVYSLPSQSTILSALAAAGGPGANGSMRKIGLRRDGRLVAELDVYEFLVRGDKSRDLQLAAGDVVVVEPVGPRIALTGALETPAIYELKRPEEPLGEVLAYAGGVPVLANPNRGQLERIDPAQPAARFVETFSLDAAGLQKPLRAGDVVTLLEISPAFANAVTLKGHVARPLRHPYTPGMRVSDLIPEREALISPDYYRRKNLLVQVIEDEDENELEPQRTSGTRDGLPATGTGGATTAPAPAPIVPGFAVPGAGGGGAALAAGAAAARSPTSGAEGSTPRRRRAGAEAAEPDDREPDAADQSLRRLAPLFDELNWNYAVIERLDMATLTTQIIPFNLGRAVIQRDPADDLELKPGDVVTVYGVKDMRVPVAQLTRLVSLEGEVLAPGVYQLMPGETLPGLIARAGGFTPEAYVYGIEFSREETRKRQRDNLSAALTRLQALAATQNAREAANRREGAPTDASVSSTATQAQLARISQLQPNGRIALELPPDARTLDGLPDVPLEHGDRILVPPRPGFVTVAGAVVNNNAFLWKPGRTAGDYVRLAGLDEAADASTMFILRADGTVSSASDRRGFFGFGGIERQALHPGDAVVVPSQLDYETWGRALVRNLKDWSQIFYQFGLGAAAIQTFRNN